MAKHSSEQKPQTSRPEEPTSSPSPVSVHTGASVTEGNGRQNCLYYLNCWFLTHASAVVAVVVVVLFGFLFCFG